MTGDRVSGYRAIARVVGVKPREVDHLSRRKLLPLPIEAPGVSGSAPGGRRPPVALRADLLAWRATEGRRRTKRPPARRDRGETRDLSVSFGALKRISAEARRRGVDRVTLMDESIGQWLDDAERNPTEALAGIEWRSVEVSEGIVGKLNRRARSRGESARDIADTVIAESLDAAGAP